MSTKHKPLQNSYWVIPGKLLAGEYPRTRQHDTSVARLQAMLDAGISRFIDLTTPADKLEKYESLLGSLSDGLATRQHFPILDLSIPGYRGEMATILNAIDRALEAGHGVYVHCWGGVGRTGTVIGCWLRRHYEDGIMLRDGQPHTLTSLWQDCPKSRTRRSPETDEQIEFVAGWNERALISRGQGCLLGQIAGDALGSLVEFMQPEAILARYPSGIFELADGGTFNTLAGQPTDDSEMALLLARDLIQRGTYDPETVHQQYLYWLDSQPFDCGHTIGNALRGEKNPASEANGALMRISPLGVFGINHRLEQVADWAVEDAALTHPNAVCLQVNALYAMAITAAIRDNLTPQALYEKICRWAKTRRTDDSVWKAVENAANELPSGIAGESMGWVLIAFQNAIYQLLHAPDLRTGVINTVMLGGDTDTNAAIAGALLGAVHGRNAIPEQWQQAILNCRPQAGEAGVKQPRPPCFWPTDVLELAVALIRGGSSESRPY
jgi:ADP-ribosyl-[dinitrogen reductase] hydrolase